MKIQILVVAAFLVLHFKGALQTKTPMEFTNQHKPVKATQYEDPKIVLDKLPGVFRILSVINLQNQLTNRTIKMDTVVQEILNLKSLKDLESFDKQKVDEFADKISRADFSSDLDIVATEDAFIGLRKIQESWISVHSKIQKFPKTVDGLNVVKTWNVSGIFKEVDIDKILKELEGGEKAHFKTLLDARAKISEFSSLENVWDLLNSIRPISNFARFMEVLNSSPLNVLKNFKTRKQGFQANLEILNDLATEDLDFKELVHLMSHPKSQDLENLSEDLHDPWILKNIQSYAPLDGLNRLIRLNKPIQEFQGSLNIPNYLETTLKTMSLKSKPVEEEKVQTLAENVFQNCFPLSHAHDPGETDKVKQLAINLNWLIIKVQALMAVAEAKNIELEETLTSLKPYLAVLKDQTNLESVIKEIMGSGNYITQFSKNSVLQDHVKLFDCIQKVPEAEFLEVSIRKIKFLREQYSEFSKSLKDISSEVSRSLESLKAVKDAGEGIRNEGNPNLTIFKDLEIYSSQIRKIQRFLNTIRVSGNPKNAFQKFQKSISELQEALYPMKSDLEAMKFSEVLEETYQKTSEKIRNFLDLLKKWKTQPKVSGNFKNLGFELTKLKEIGDLEIPGTSEIDSFELTKPGRLVKKELSNLKGAIRMMGGLELRFSSYNVSVEDVEKIFGILRNGSKNSENGKTDIDHSGPTAFMITMICVGIVVFCAFLYFCLFDYRFPLYTVRQNLCNKMYKNKQKNMKTAREGQPPISGFSAQKDVNRGADGREIREKNQPGSAESLPPPPPPIPEAKPVSKETDPLNSPRALKKELPPIKELKVQKTDETLPTPPATAKATIKKQPSRTKTTVEPSKTTKTITKDESAADKKTPPPQAPLTKIAPPTKQPSKKKDTLADDVDSTEKVKKTKSESKITYTRESKNTLDDVDPKIFNGKSRSTKFGMFRTSSIASSERKLEEKVN
ncbi:hypothetical protein L3Y34_000308 [Caenorhabditis briggsae]|uniref:Domain of unknown function WSN domain-containing protein n=1 Tax=Caenorhabditis briggsae TaxID=6238 RepID=A0AAE9IN66_CAEBR|nr:hypothetical protein L3Y34_000308 [Caenorhabditis briggsae]